MKPSRAHPRHRRSSDGRGPPTRPAQHPARDLRPGAGAQLAAEVGLASGYYGVGGGKPNDDFSGVPSAKLYGPDADFDDHDHELYDLQEDPHELVNLAHDRGSRAHLRRRFDELRALEATAFAPLTGVRSA